MITIVNAELSLTIATALCYFLAAVGYGAFMMLRTKGLVRAARLATAIGVVCHTCAIGFHCATTHETPFMTPADTLSATAWAIALAVLCLEILIKTALPAIAAVSMPAAFLCLFTGTILRSKSAVGAAQSTKLLNSGIVSLHVTAIILAFGLIVLAFASSVLYVAQNRILKHKHISGRLFGKLPPLVTLDHVSFVLTSFAFPLLTLGLFSGVIKATTNGWTGNWELDEKIVASFLTWVVYGAYLALHGTSQWRGLRSNYLVVIGLVLAVATLFVPTAVHKF